VIQSWLTNRFTVKLMRDDALVQAYANGEALAFEELYSRHKSLTINVMNRLLNLKRGYTELRIIV